MSVLGEYPEAIDNKKDLQIWNNAAFDNGCDSETLSSNNLMKSPSWLVKKPVSGKLVSDSFDSFDSIDSFNSSFSSKENRSPSGLSKSSVSVHSLHQSKPLKDQNVVMKIGLSKPGVLEKSEEKSEEEIEIENEISRLFAKLELIRLKKAEQKSKNLENSEKMVVRKKLNEPPKKNESGVMKIKESGLSRRGFSLGPNEIMSATNSKSKQLAGGGTTTPIQSTQNRRKSCFWKLEDIEEEKIGFSRGKNVSIRQAVTTLGSKKSVKKDDSILGSVQPKKLFGEQSVPAKKPLKPGRVIPSRYNQATVTSSMRKRSLTDNTDRKPRGTEGRVKKKWEIPTEIVIPKKLNLDDNDNDDVDSICPIDVLVPAVLPRIRAVRCVDEPDRDSGPAKRVAELIGKKSYFECIDEERLCQNLSFEEEIEM